MVQLRGHDPIEKKNRYGMDWVQYGLHVLGVPRLDEVLPAPTDIAERMNIPTLRDVVLDIRSNVEANLERRGIFKPR